jgi:hypothetical protein
MWKKLTRDIECRTDIWRSRPPVVFASIPDRPRQDSCQNFTLDRLVGDREQAQELIQIKANALDFALRQFDALPHNHAKATDEALFTRQLLAGRGSGERLRDPLCVNSAHFADSVLRRQASLRVGSSIKERVDEIATAASTNSLTIRAGDASEASSDAESIAVG